MSIAPSSSLAQGALEAVRELRQRLEGFVPFEQAGQVHDLFAAALASLQALAVPSQDTLPGSAVAAQAASAALVSLQELHGLVEGAIPAAQADYLGALFGTVLEPVHALVSLVSLPAC